MYSPLKKPTGEYMDKQISAAIAPSRCWKECNEAGIASER
jgi:hypothetical protein